MPEKKLRNGNGPRQTYYVNKPIKSPHKTMFKTPPLTYQFARKKQENAEPISNTLFNKIMLCQSLCVFDYSNQQGGSYKIR